MREAYLHTPSFALGATTYSVEESAAAGRTRSAADELRGAGFADHHIAGPGETVLDLALSAVAPIAEHLGAGALAGIDIVAWATCIPANENLAPAEKFNESRDAKDLMDYPASRFQAALGLENAAVIGLGQQACTSLLGSLRLARAYIATEPEIHNVLCVTSDRFPAGAIYEQAYCLISDGAAACVVSDEPSPGALKIVASGHITNGAMVLGTDDETVGSYFNYTHRLITEILARSDLRPDEIDWVVPQNTNISAWKILSRLVGVEMDHIWFPSMPDAAHVISGDNIVNLSSLVTSGALRSGDRILMTMAGYGMNWQATVLEAV